MTSRRCPGAPPETRPTSCPPAAPPSADPPQISNAPKPGEIGWVPPVPVIEPADVTPEEIAGAQATADIEQHKAAAVLAYILFLIPLIVAPHSKFARYHANQGLLLFILLIIVAIAVTVLKAAAWAAHYFLQNTVELLASFFSCGFSLLQVAFLIGWLALLVMGIINAANGLKKPLLLIGHWTLIHDNA